MTFEAIPTTTLRASELRRLHGETWSGLERLRTALVTENGLSVEVELVLASVCFGRGKRRLLACPGCGSGSEILTLHERELRCSKCRPRRSRRQMEKNLRSWNRLGGREEDSILRLLSRTRVTTEMARRARRRIRRLLEADQARVQSARDKLQELELAASAG